MSKKGEIISRDKKRKIVLLTGIIVVSIIFILYGVNHNNKDFTQQPGYEQKLKNAIEEKNQKLAAPASNNEWFVITKEMEENPKYQNPDGSIDEDALYEDLGISNTTPTGALEEIPMKAVDNHVEPHVLGQAEVAIYSDNDDNPWRLEKGDKIEFHTYVDTKYYNAVGQIYFGTLKDGELFLTDNLGEGFSVEQEKEFVYIAPEKGQYQFYIFRGSTEPIIIKWIEISKN